VCSFVAKCLGKAVYWRVEETLLFVEAGDQIGCRYVWDSLYLLEVELQRPGEIFPCDVKLVIVNNPALPAESFEFSKSESPRVGLERAQDPLQFRM